MHYKMGKTCSRLFAYSPVKRYLVNFDNYAQKLLEIQTVQSIKLSLSILATAPERLLYHRANMKVEDDTDEYSNVFFDFSLTVKAALRN